MVLKGLTVTVTFYIGYTFIPGDNEVMLVPTFFYAQDHIITLFLSCLSVYVFVRCQLYKHSL